MRGNLYFVLSVRLFDLGAGQARDQAAGVIVFCAPAWSFKT